MRSGSCTNPDRSVPAIFHSLTHGADLARRAIVCLLWLVWGIGSTRPATGQSPVPEQVPTETAVELAWNWPAPIERDGWLEAGRDAARWWLAIDLPERVPVIPANKIPQNTLPQSGHLALEVHSEPAIWAFTSVTQSPEGIKSAITHPHAPWHRAVLPRTTEERLVLAEVMIDLNAVRRADPQRAGFGSIARLLEYWKLSNARELMVHVRAAPRPAPLPMVVEIDLTWSVRSDPPRAIRVLRLSKPLGPVESATLTPEGAAWTLAMPMDVRLVIARAVGAAMASRDGGAEHEEFDRSILRWARSVRDRVTRMRAVLSDRVLLSGNGSWLQAKVPLARARGGRSVAADMTALQARLKSRATHDTLSGRVMLNTTGRLKWEVFEDDTGSWLRLQLGSGERSAGDIQSGSP